MNMSTLKESLPESAENNDRVKELKAFDETKSGVKGLVDSGISKIPKIFIRPHHELAVESNHGRSNIQVPIIDLRGFETDDDHRKKIIYDLKQASKDCGFFQVLNHGIPLSVLDGMIDGIRRFHEQDAEIKKEFYSRDRIKKVKYVSNIDLYRSSAANWRDTLTISPLASDRVEPDELPAVCRSSIIEYIDQLTKLGELLFELLAEALGLKREHLVNMGCGRGRTFVCHYYPECPEPELAMGTSKHTDPAFLTILLQDQIGGLQVLKNNQWIDVQPLAGSLVVNIGDFLQIISNDEFKSAEHRVVANRVGPRISTACFFTGVAVPPKIYGPIDELVTKENPPIYKDFTVRDYISKFFSKAIGKSSLDDFKLQV
ncbi:1-aminocyclopropane-1-carboxylate oxidase1 [Abeliophyllum distichum]|uniref:1-aminocyclopropane-1-carboxylate oxidase1 n=1 Tax=Abeliophyllum distichum TaxID=126358 RepID=A0ABD1T240_9LAMI